MAESTAEPKNSVLEDMQINVKLKLAALWTSVILVYVYVDFIGFYEPGTIDDILAGIVFEFQITQTWALVALVLLTIPSLMIFLSLALPAKVNRWMNILVGLLYIVVSIGSAVGESWPYYIFGGAVEVTLLALVVWYAWKWPRTTGNV